MSHNPNPHHDIQGPQAIVAGSWSFTQQLPNGRQMQMSGYLFQGESVDVLNAKIDMQMAVLDRVRGKAEIPEFRHKVKLAQKQLDEFEQTAAALMEKKRTSPKRLASVEEQQINTIDGTRATLKKNLLEGLEKVEELVSKFGEGY